MVDLFDQLLSPAEDVNNVTTQLFATLVRLSCGYVFLFVFATCPLA